MKTEQGGTTIACTSTASFEQNAPHEGEWATEAHGALTGVLRVGACAERCGARAWVLVLHVGASFSTRVMHVFYQVCRCV